MICIFVAVAPFMLFIFHAYPARRISNRSTKLATRFQFQVLDSVYFRLMIHAKLYKDVSFNVFFVEITTISGICSVLICYTLHYIHNIYLDIYIFTYVLLGSCKLKKVFFFHFLQPTDG